MENRNVVMVAQMARQRLGFDALAKVEAIAKANAAEGDADAARFWSKVAFAMRAGEK